MCMYMLSTLQIVDGPMFYYTQVNSTQIGDSLPLERN